jgi:hypothetical protein
MVDGPARIPLAREKERRSPRANRMASGKDCRARRRALDFDVVVVEADALGRTSVDARRGYRSAVGPKISQPTLSTRIKTMLGAIFCPPYNYNQLPKVDGTLLKPGASMQTKNHRSHAIASATGKTNRQILFEHCHM